MIFYSFKDIMKAYQISMEQLKRECLRGKLSFQKLNFSRDNKKSFKYIIPESELVKFEKFKISEPVFNPASQPDYYINKWAEDDRKREEIKRAWEARCAEFEKRRKAYAEYLNSDKWKEKRAERLKIDGYRCRLCGTGKNLVIHHVTYVRFGNEDVIQDLITLCKKCHNRVHQNDLNN